MSTCSTSIFKDPNVAKHLSLLHDKYVTVSADKAPNTIIFVCKSHYIDCLIKELGIHNSLGNPIYTPTTLAKEEILDKHRSVLCSCWISTKYEELDLPSLYWLVLYQIYIFSFTLSIPALYKYSLQMTSYTSMLTPRVL
jgi:hypothetical protein